MKTFIQTKYCNLVAGFILALGSTLPALAADLNVPAQYPTVQTAVDATSSGDTIHIAPGVYVEQITIIDKRLTLAGTPGAIIRASSAMVQTLLARGFTTDWSPLVGVVRSDVTVQDLVLEGEHMANTTAAKRMAGIYFLTSTGSVERCTMQGFGGRVLDDTSEAYGLLVINAVSLGAPIVTVKVLNSKFADNQTAMAFVGDDFAAPNTLRTLFEVADNQISGVGTNAIGQQIGILISEGAGGVIRRNTITDHSFTGGGFIFSAGISAPVDRAVVTQPIRIEGNSFRNNQLSVSVLLANSSQIVDNTFLGPGTGYRPHGLVVSGDGIQIISNRFSNLPTGTVLLGDDPDFGTSLGIATNATLIGNRFCDVITSIDIEPPATVLTNQGTLLCPFPPPPLAVAPAVLLTWPAIDTGYVVECATNVAGPWTLLGITPTVTGKEFTVSVRATDAAKYFRLRSP